MKNKEEPVLFAAWTFEYILFHATNKEDMIEWIIKDAVATEPIHTNVIAYFSGNKDEVWSLKEFLEHGWAKKKGKGYIWNK